MSQHGPAFETEFPTFVVAATAILTANNKSMLALAVSSAAGAPSVKIRQIHLVNSQGTLLVIGVVAAFEIRRITSFAAGTAITPLPYDTSDTLAAQVTAATGSTVAGESASLLRRALWSTDEWGPGPADVESADHALQTVLPLWTKQHNARPLTLRPGEGITIKCATSTITGTFDIFVEFTQE